MRVLLGLAVLAPSCFGQTYGTWKLDSARSSFTRETRPKSLTLRIGQHPKGEVLTVDRVERDGRITSSSTVLYLDGAPHEFQDFGCAGKQSSRRIDSQTVEILRVCESGEWIRTTRRSAPQPNELVLEIVVYEPGGRQFEDRLVLKRQ